MNLLFMTIGQRDCMGVVDHEGNLTRIEINNSNIKDLVSLPFLQTNIEINPKKEKLETKELDLKGLDFPMLSKNLSALKDIHSKNHIHKLILIVTDRRNNLTLINKAKEESLHQKWKDCSDFAKDLVNKYIQNDKSKQTAELIIMKMDEITNYHKIKIDDVDILSIGEIFEEDFNNVVIETSSQMMNYLKSFDLNNIDYLTRQFHNKIISLFDFSEMDDSENNIFLSLYAGGLPLLQKAVENILYTGFINANLIPVYITESSSYLKITKNANSYYTILKELIQSVKNNDFYDADRKYNLLKNYVNTELNQPVLNDIEALFKKIKDFKENKENWFYNLFSLFFSSIYKDDFITASVFLVSLEDQYFRFIIKKHIDPSLFTDKEKKILINGFEQDININLIDKLIDSPNNQEFQKLIDEFNLKFKPLFLKQNKNIYQKFRLIYTGNYQKFRDERNFFIHRGMSQLGNFKIRENILHFLKITRLYNDIMRKINSDQYKWEDILNFEKSLLIEDTIFHTIAKNVYGEDFNHLTPEREIGLDLIHLIIQIVL